MSTTHDRAPSGGAEGFDLIDAAIASMSEHGFAPGDDAYAVHEVVRRDVLEQEAARSGTDGGVHVLVEVEGG